MKYHDTYYIMYCSMLSQTFIWILRTCVWVALHSLMYHHRYEWYLQSQHRLSLKNHPWWMYLRSPVLLGPNLSKEFQKIVAFNRCLWSSLLHQHELTSDSLNSSGSYVHACIAYRMCSKAMTNKMKFIYISTFFLAHKVDHFRCILPNFPCLPSRCKIKIIRCGLTPIDGWKA